MSVAALVVGVTMVVLAWPSQDSPTPSGPPVAAFLGDSYTVGFGSSVEERRWTSLVAQQEGWVERNFGEGGSGYIQPGWNGTSYLGRVEQVVKAAPDIVVVAGGQNDVVSNGDVPAAVRATLLLLREGLPHATIYVLGPTWPDPNPPQRLLEIQDAAKKAAREVHGRFIPALDVMAGRPDLLALDHIHPNDAGHLAIARRVIAAIRGRG